MKQNPYRIRRNSPTKTGLLQGKSAPKRRTKPGVTLSIQDANSKELASVELPAAVYAAVMKCCNKHGITLSEFMNIAFAEHLERVFPDNGGAR